MNTRQTNYHGTDRCLLWHTIAETPRPDEWCFILTRYDRTNFGPLYQVMHDNYAVKKGAALGFPPGFTRKNVEHIIGWMPDPDPPEDIGSIPDYWVRTPLLPGRQQWCHILRIGKNGRLRMENDLYAVDTARAHGNPEGFCVCRTYGKDAVIAWLPWPVLPCRAIITALEHAERRSCGKDTD